MTQRDLFEPIRKVTQDMASGGQKDRSHQKPGDAARGHVVNRLAQIRGHELQKGTTDRELRRPATTSLGDRMEGVSPSRIACAMAKQNQPLIGCCRRCIDRIHRIVPTQASNASATESATRLGMLTDNQAGQVLSNPR